MKQVLKSERARVLTGIIMLCVLSLAPSLVAIAGGLWPFDDDAIALFGPWRVWARDVLHTGVLPLWNPHLFGGMPFISNGQTAVFYPPNIVYWLLPIHPAMLLDAAFHSVLLGVGGYLLARVLDRSQLAAWLCTICLMLGNGVASHLYAGHMTWHAARSYLPLIAWTLICFLRYAKPQYLWALACFFALQVFSGYPPYVLWSVCWCAVFFVAWRWAARGRALPAISPSRLLLPGVLLVLLSAVVALPLRETSGLSTHGEALSYSHATTPSSTLGGWARLMLPNFFGGNRVAQWSITKFPHEEAAYIGLLPLGLAMFSPLLWRWKEQEASDETEFNARRFVGALWLILPIALLLALGKYTPVYRVLFDALPPLRMFRVPARWFEIWYFAACVLAAFGLDAYLKLPPWRLKRILPAIAIFALLLVGAAIAIGISPTDSPFWLDTAQWNKRGLNADFAERLRYAKYLQLIALESVITAAGIMLCTLFLLNRLQQKQLQGHQLLNICGARNSLWAKLLLVLVAADLLLIFWSSARFALDAHPKNPWPRGIERFYKSGDRWATAFEDEAFGYGLDQGLPLSIDILGGYDALASKNFFLLAGAIEGRELWSSQYQAETYSPLWKVAGITQVFASGNSEIVPVLRQRGAKLLSKFGTGKSEMQLWKLSGAWPREFLAGRVLRAPREQQLPLLSELAMQSTPVAVVDETAFSSLPFERQSVLFSHEHRVARVLQSTRGVNVRIVEVEASGPQVLVQSEVLFPGWRAWVNGKSTKVHAANFLFRGVEVPGGKSRVVLVYDNQTYRFGTFLSLLGLSLLAGVLSFATGNRRARRPAAARSNSTS